MLKLSINFSGMLFTETYRFSSIAVTDETSTKRKFWAFAHISISTMTYASILHMYRFVPSSISYCLEKLTRCMAIIHFPFYLSALHTFVMSLLTIIKSDMTCSPCKWGNEITQLFRGFIFQLQHSVRYATWIERYSLDIHPLKVFRHFWSCS